MRAVYAESINPQDPLAGLVVGERPDPVAPEGWATVTVKAAALNHHDVWSLRGVGLPCDTGLEPFGDHTTRLAGTGTAVQPLHGRLLGFGHFVFESAAQEQGLKEIRYVARVDERDLTIQRVVQRSGLRGPRVG